MHHKREYKLYEAYSLVEVIIAIFVIGMVMILTSFVYTTLLKTSTITTSRTIVRQETAFMHDVLERYIKLSSTSDIRAYSDRGWRLNEGSLSMTAEFQSQEQLDSGDLINGFKEMHFKSNENDTWYCITLAEDRSTEGNTSVIVLSYANGSPDNCFAPNTFRSNGYVLTNEDIDIEEFRLSANSSSTNGTVIFLVEITATPLQWTGGAQGKIKPSFKSTRLVKTENLTTLN